MSSFASLRISALKVTTYYRFRYKSSLSRESMYRFFRGGFLLASPLNSIIPPTVFKSRCPMSQLSQLTIAFKKRGVPMSQVPSKRSAWIVHHPHAPSSSMANHDNLTDLLKLCYKSRHGIFAMLHYDRQNLRARRR